MSLLLPPHFNQLTFLLEHRAQTFVLVLISLVCFIALVLQVKGKQSVNAEKAGLGARTPACELVYLSMVEVL